MSTRTLLCMSLLMLLATTRVRADTVWLHTREVEALTIHDGALWSATTGGLERYELTTLRRTHHLTTADGLDTPHVRALSIRDGALVAHTARSACTVALPTLRCAPEIPVAHASEAWSVQTFRGAAVTARLVDAGRTLIATRGAGLWLVQGETTRRLTPSHQICAHHAQAAAVFRGAVWIGGFREGLCVRRGKGFVPVEVPFRFVNDLRVHRGRLYVAANEGLFVSDDGARFRPVREVWARGVNGLAAHADTLWVSTPTVLFAVPPRGRVRTLVKPGGTRSMQAVAADARGTLWVATEDRGLLRIRGDEITPFDALRGLGASWVVDVEVDAQGSVYAATLRDGLYRIDPSGDIVALSRTPHWLLRLAQSDEGLWIGSQEGLARLRSDGQVDRIAALPDSRVHVVLPTRDALWIGTEHGVVERAR